MLAGEFLLNVNISICPHILRALHRMWILLYMLLLKSSGDFVYLRLRFTAALPAC